MIKNGPIGRERRCGDALISHLMMDVDGVVVTGRPGDGKDWKTDLERDIGVSSDTLVDLFFSTFWDKVVTGKLALRPTLKQALSGIANQDQIDALVAYWFRMDARLDEGVLGDLKRVQAAGIPIWFATNQDHERSSYLWNTLKLKDRAERLVSSAQIGVAKPSPAFFEALQNMTGIAASEHLLIDDSAGNVGAAQSAGWHAVQWTAGMRLSDVLQGFGVELAA